MKLGYNTNGLTGHRWDQALELMHEIGYRSVAITVDHHCLNPFSDDLPAELERMRRLLERYEMISCIETGARFLLDPRQKHEPTLVSAAPERRADRVDFLKRCVDIAASLESQAVSFWAGVVRDGASRDEALNRLVPGVIELMQYASQRHVPLAFEPEPGMLVETFDDFRELLNRVEFTGPGSTGTSTTNESDTGGRLGLCVDIGHVHCLEPRPIAEYLAQWQDRIVTIHIEDMNRGVHDHLRFGEGSIDFRSVMNELREINYRGGVNVELSPFVDANPADNAWPADKAGAR